jgi:hypothetical protein
MPAVCLQKCISVCVAALFSWTLCWPVKTLILLFSSFWPKIKQKLAPKDATFPVNKESDQRWLSWQRLYLCKHPMWSWIECKVTLEPGALQRNNLLKAWCVVQKVNFLPCTSVNSSHFPLLSKKCGLNKLWKVCKYAFWCLFSCSLTKTKNGPGKN